MQKSGSNRKKTPRNENKRGGAAKIQRQDAAKYLPNDMDPGEAELLLAWGSYLEERYPNPDRIDCPGTELLKKIAGAPKDFHDRKVLDHVARCAPCANEMRELLFAARRPAN